MNTNTNFIISLLTGLLFFAVVVVSIAETASRNGYVEIYTPHDIYHVDMMTGEIYSETGQFWTFDTSREMLDWIAETTANETSGVLTNDAYLKAREGGFELFNGGESPMGYFVPVEGSPDWFRYTTTRQ